MVSDEGTVAFACVHVAVFDPIVYWQLLEQIQYSGDARRPRHARMHDSTTEGTHAQGVESMNQHRRQNKTLALRQVIAVPLEEVRYDLFRVVDGCLYIHEAYAVLRELKATYRQQHKIIGYRV